jgi:hypothetical protein
MLEDCEDRFLPTNPLHSNPDASADPMDPVQRLGTVGHNARVFISNRRLTGLEETVNLGMEGDMQSILGY